MKGVLFVISGPSGVGKGTLVKEILNERNDLKLSVSCTTRAPRQGETNGKEYFFIDREEFVSRIRENGFLEYDEHFGNYYGTPRSYVERQLKDNSVILEIDVVGALNCKRLMPEAVLIMIAPPSIEELSRRLESRGSESDETIKNRLERVKYELGQKQLYDYVIVNDALNEAKIRLLEVIDTEINKRNEGE